MQEGACQRVHRQRAHEHNNQVAPPQTQSYSRPHSLALTSLTRRHHDCQHVAHLGGISTPLNDAPNIASPHKGDHPTKRGGTRKVSLSRLGWCFVASVTATIASGSQTNAEYHNESALICWPMGAMWQWMEMGDALVAGANGNKDGRLGMGSLLCRGICNSFFGSTLTFAVKSMQHTANHLQQWARKPDFRVRSFTCSELSTSKSVCHPYHGVVLDRMSSPQEGFIFCVKSCSRNGIIGPWCSYCISNINVKKKMDNPMSLLSSAPGSR